MQLTVREAAVYLGVGERRVRAWIAERGMPAHRMNERLMLNPIELWEWATAQGIPVSRSLLELRRRVVDDTPTLSALLEAGGIFSDVEAAGKPEILRAIVARLRLPPEVDREFLVSVLEAREALGSTGIGDGIAIPHVRNPLLLGVQEPLVALFLLAHPIAFDTVDGLPVHALFTVIAPGVSVHLKILSRLGLVLRDAALRDALRRRAPAAEILDRVRALEERSTGSFRAPPGDHP